MSKKKSGLRIGRYQLTPLGIGVLAAILLLLVALIVILALKHRGSEADKAAPVTSGNVQIVVQTPTATQTPAPTATLAPTPTPAPTLRSARIRSLGEIVADNDVLKSAYIQQQDEEGNDTSSFDFSSMFEMAAAAMGDADYTVAQVDGTMGGKGLNGYRGKDGEYNTPPHIMLPLRESGVDMLALASDHALDEFYEGLSKTIANCVQAELDYVGAATSQEEHDAPKIVNVNGINIAFLNYAESFNGKEKNAAKEALEFGVSYTGNANPEADVTAARAAGADVVVAYMSWGSQGSEKLTKNQAAIAKVLVTAGVDVILGYNPRVLQSQPMYWLEVETEAGAKQRTLCVCSLGSFLTGSREAAQDHGVIFEFTISETEEGGFEIINPTYIPTYVWRTEKSDGLYDYKVLAVGEWLSAAPDGMSDADYERLQAVWSEVQSKLGTTELSVAAN